MSAPDFSENGPATSAAADAPTSATRHSPLTDGRNDFNVVFIHSRLDDYGLPPAEFRVYANLARRAGNDGAYPAVKRIASDCRLHPKTVRRALQVLLHHNLINAEIRPGFTTVYRLTPASEWRPPNHIAGTPRPTNTPASKWEDTTSNRMHDNPSQTDTDEGNPSEGNPPKANTHDRRAPVGLPSSEAEAVEAAKLAGIPEDFARKEFNGRAAVGWVNGAGLAIKSWPHYLRKRWTDEQGQRAERAARPGAGRAAPNRQPTPPRQFTPDDYK